MSLTPPIDAAATLETLLSERYSCRRYLRDRVPRPLIDRMLATAQRSASWCNSQPWQAIITEGGATERLREALYAHVLAEGLAGMTPDMPFPAAYRGVYKERQREVGWQLYESVGIAPGDRSGSARQALENFRLFGAPHLAVITSERDLGVYGVLDCGIYLSSLMLAAQSLGIAMIAQAAIAGYAPFIRDHFDIPEHRAVVVGVSFGFADTDAPENRFRARRAVLDEVVRYVGD